MITEKNPEKAKRLIAKETKPIIVEGGDDTFNRKMIEYGRFDILLSPEKGQRKNSLRQQDSGLNHFLAKLAAKNRISIGINIEEIRKLPKKEKAERLAKIRQNIKICRKAKTKLTVLGNKGSASLLLSLGASSQQVKEATQPF